MEEDQINKNESAKSSYSHQDHSIENFDSIKDVLLKANSNEFRIASNPPVKKPQRAQMPKLTFHQLYTKKTLMSPEGVGNSDSQDPSFRKIDVKHKSYQVPSKTFFCLKVDNKLRKLLIRIHFSPFAFFLRNFLIVVFLLLAPFTNIATLEPKPGSLLTISKRQAVNFIIVSNTCFLFLLLAGAGAVGLYSSKNRQIRQESLETDPSSPLAQESYEGGPNKQQLRRQKGSEGSHETSVGQVKGLFNSLLEIMDLCLAIFHLIYPSCYPSLDGLRILILLRTLRDLRTFPRLTELMNIMSTAYPSVSAILIVNVIWTVFVAMFLNNLTDLDFTRRCRLLLHGNYKIDDEYQFLCHSSGETRTCPSTHLCLSASEADELNFKGFQSDDITKNLTFKTIYHNVLIMMQIQTFDNWGTSFMILISSKIGSIIVILLFLMTTYLSVVSKGLIISVYLSICASINQKSSSNAQETMNPSLSMAFSRLIKQATGNANSVSSKRKIEISKLKTSFCNTIKKALKTLFQNKGPNLSVNTFYYNNWFTNLAYRIAHLKLYMTLDFLAITYTGIFLCFPASLQTGFLLILYNGLSILFICHTTLKCLSVGLQGMARRWLYIVHAVQAIVVLIEITKLNYSYSSILGLRVLLLLRHIAKIKLPKEVKIFIKSLIHFYVYLPSYIFLCVCFLWVAALVSYDFVEPEYYLMEILQEVPVDPFVKYLAGSFSLLYTTDWSDMMLRADLKYGPAISIVFVFVVAVTRYALEYSMISFFIFIYSTVYAKHIAEDSGDNINLSVEKLDYIGTSGDTVSSRFLRSRVPPPKSKKKRRSTGMSFAQVNVLQRAQTINCNTTMMRKDTIKRNTYNEKNNDDKMNTSQYKNKFNQDLKELGKTLQKFSFEDMEGNPMESLSSDKNFDSKNLLGPLKEDNLKSPQKSQRNIPGEEPSLQSKADQSNSNFGEMLDRALKRKSSFSNLSGSSNLSSKSSFSDKPDRPGQNSKCYPKSTFSQYYLKHGVSKAREAEQQATLEPTTAIKEEDSRPLDYLNSAGIDSELQIKNDLLEPPEESKEAPNPSTDSISSAGVVPDRSKPQRTFSRPIDSLADIPKKEGLRMKPLPQIQLSQMQEVKKKERLPSLNIHTRELLLPSSRKGPLLPPINSRKLSPDSGHLQQSSSRGLSPVEKSSNGKAEKPSSFRKPNPNFLVEKNFEKKISFVMPSCRTLYSDLESDGIAPSQQYQEGQVMKMRLRRALSQKSIKSVTFSIKDQHEPQSSDMAVPSETSKKSKILSSKKKRKKDKKRKYNDVVPSEQSNSKIRKDTPHFTRMISRSMKIGNTPKVPCFVKIYTTSAYNNMTLVVSAADLFLMGLSTRFNYCTGHFPDYMIILISWVSNVFFIVEIGVALWIKCLNKNLEEESTLRPKVPFRWSEVLLVAANCIRAVLYPGLCHSSLLLSLMNVLCCLNGYRIITRVAFFKKYMVAIGLSLRSIKNLMPLYLCLIITITPILHSLYRDKIFSCSFNGLQYAIPKEHCTSAELSGSSQQPAPGAKNIHYTDYMVNFSTILNTFLANYVNIHGSLWTRVIDAYLVEADYRGIISMFIYALLYMGFVRIVYNAGWLVITYLHFRNSALIHSDKKANMTEEYTEYVQIDEAFSKIHLVKKVEKVTHPWSILCKKISNSSKFIFCIKLYIILAFILNLTSYTGEPDSLTQAKLWVNIFCCLMINMHVYFQAQALNFVSLGDHQTLLNHIYLILACDIVVILSFSFSFYVNISLQVIYIHVFEIIGDICFFVSRKSKIAFFLKEFLTVIPSNRKQVYLASILIYSITLILVFNLPDNSSKHLLEVEQAAGTIITWIYDTDWFKKLLDFRFQYNSLPAWRFYIFLVATFLVHFFFKVIFHTSLISSLLYNYKEMTSFDNCVFNNELIEKIAQKWMEIDTKGEGFISVTDYYKFIINLQPPLSLCFEDFVRRLKSDGQKFLEGRSKKVYLKSEANKIELTVKQFFLFFRVYNVPIYVISNAPYYIVHFKDAAEVLAKVAIENKYDLEEPLKTASKKIERNLLTLWEAKYRKLSSLISKYEEISTDKMGHKYRGFDVRLFQAQQIIKEYCKKRTIILNAKEQRIYSYKVTKEQEDVGADKLDLYTKINHELNLRRLYGDLMSQTQIRKHMMNQIQKGSSAVFKIQNTEQLDEGQESPVRRRMSSASMVIDPDKEREERERLEKEDLKKIFMSASNDRTSAKWLKKRDCKTLAGITLALAENMTPRASRGKKRVPLNQRMEEADIVRGIENFKSIGLRENSVDDPNDDYSFEFSDNDEEMGHTHDNHDNQNHILIENPILTSETNI